MLDKNKHKRIIDKIEKYNVVVLEFNNIHKMIEWFNDNDYLLSLPIVYKNLMFEVSTFVDVKCRISITKSGITIVVDGDNIGSDDGVYTVNKYINEWLK